MGALAVLTKLVPVVLAFGVGAVFARRKIVPADSSKVFSDFAFLFAIPCYLLTNIYRSDLHALFYWRAISGYVTGAFVGVLAVGLVARLMVGADTRSTAMRIMAGVQVNTAYFAVPVFIMLFGTAAPIFPILLFQVCVLSSLVILIMELGPAEEGSGNPLKRLGRALWSSLNTPVVLACNLGILLNLTSVHVPASLLDGFSFVGASASPVALFALGLHIGGAGLALRGTSVEELWLVGFKCLLFPLFTWALCGLVLGVSGVWLQYLVLIAAMPAPQNLFIFAQRYNVDVGLSASLVIKSSVASLVLLPLWIQAVHG
ncbi:AEC family transporter [Streptomyces sp. NPDC001393]